MDEVWKDIQGYEGYYQISNLGRVRSLRHRFGLREEPLIQAIRRDGGGYQQCKLSKDGVSTYPKVHLLVARHFIPNPDNLPQVNHIWEDKDRNTVEDLEWCTAQYNAEYTHAKHYTFINPEGLAVEVFNLRQFCMLHGLTAANMQKVHSGERRQHKGWKRWQ